MESSNVRETKQSPGPDADRTVVQERIYSAPRELVWQAFTGERHLDAWWGPNGFRNRTESMDFRIGGRWRYQMLAPDGTNYPNWIQYTAIEAPMRLAYDHGGEESEGAHFQVEVSFEAIDAGTTRVVMRSLFPSAEIVRQLVEEVDAIESGKQTLARLAGHLPALAAGTTDGSLVLTRLLDHPVERVFAAWSTDDALMRWWGPTGFTLPTCELDFRPGGAYRMVMRDPAGGEHPFHGHYREIVEHQRIVFDATILEGVEVLTTVTFVAEGTKTLLTVQQTTPTDPQAAAGQQEGWNGSLIDLEEALKVSELVPFTVSREFDAPLALLWEIFTRAEHLAGWMGPEGTEVLASELDLRVGGRHHYGTRAPEGHETWGLQVYREIVPLERLIYLQSFADPEGRLTPHPAAPTWPLQMLSTLTFEALAGDRSRLTVTWVPYAASPEQDATFDGARDGMRGGFAGMFETLEAYLTTR